MNANTNYQTKSTIAPAMTPEYQNALSRAVQLLSTPSASAEAVMDALQDYHDAKSLMIGYDDGWIPDPARIASQHKPRPIPGVYKSGAVSAASKPTTDCHKCGSEKKRNNAGQVYCQVCKNEQERVRQAKKREMAAA